MEKGNETELVRWWWIRAELCVFSQMAAARRSHHHGDESGGDCYSGGDADEKRRTKRVVCSVHALESGCHLHSMDEVHRKNSPEPQISHDVRNRQ